MAGSSGLDGISDLFSGVDRDHHVFPGVAVNPESSGADDFKIMVVAMLHERKIELMIFVRGIQFVDRIAGVVVDNFNRVADFYIQFRGRNFPIFQDELIGIGGDRAGGKEGSRIIARINCILTCQNDLGPFPKEKRHSSIFPA